jgi:hypothetical protein
MTTKNDPRDGSDGVTETTSTTSTDAFDDDLRDRVTDPGDQAGTAPAATDDEPTETSE